MKTSVQPENYTLSKDSKELCIDSDVSRSIYTLNKDEFNNFISGKPQVTTVDINKMIEIEEGLESLNITKISFFGSELNEFKLPKSPPKFENLKELEISNCGMSEIFPISGFSKLEKLTIFECGGLKKIPSLSKLKELKEININICYSINELPNTSECPKLEKLTLSGNPNLKTILSLSKNVNLKLVNLSMSDQIDFTQGLTDELQTLQQSECAVIYPEREYQRIQANSQQNPAPQTNEQIRSAGVDRSPASDDIEAGSRDISASAPHGQRAGRGFRDILTNFITGQFSSALGVNPENLMTPVTRAAARRDPNASGVASQPSRTPNNRAQDQDGNNHGNNSR